jgi:flagellar motor switch protein FliN
MNEGLEESVLASGVEGAPGSEFVGISEYSPRAGSLEKALNLSEANRTGSAPQKFGANSSAPIQHENNHGGGMMPQGSLLKIPVNVQVILGTTRMSLSKVMSLGPGSIVALDKELSEPVVLLVNGNEVARGLIVVVNEKTGQLGVSLTEIAPGGSGESSSKPV